MRGVTGYTVKQLLTNARARATLSPEQKLVQGDVKFPLYVHLKNLRQEQNVKFDTQNAILEALRKDISQLPLVILGTLAGTLTVIQLIVYPVVAGILPITPGKTAVADTSHGTNKK